MIHRHSLCRIRRDYYYVRAAHNASYAGQLMTLHAADVSGLYERKVLFKACASYYVCS